MEANGSRCGKAGRKFGRRRSPRRFVGRLAGTLVVVAVLTVPATAAASLPNLWTGFTVRHSFFVRPPEVSYTGDGSGYLGGFDGTGIYPNFGSLTWTSWTRRFATANGADWIKTCVPDCAHSPFVPVAVTVTAFKPRQRHFRRMTLQFTYQGKAYTDRRVLRPGFAHGSYAWAIL